jgi:hypothetical protein
VNGIAQGDAAPLSGQVGEEESQPLVEVEHAGRADAYSLHILFADRGFLDDLLDQVGDAIHHHVVALAGEGGLGFLQQDVAAVHVDQTGFDVGASEVTAYVNCHNPSMFLGGG